jgi:hypothetical protein
MKLTEDENMKRITEAIVAEMKIGEKIKKLKLGETMSIKVNVSDYLKTLNDEPKAKSQKRGNQES